MFITVTYKVANFAAQLSKQPWISDYNINQKVITDFRYENKLSKSWR